MEDDSKVEMSQIPDPDSNDGPVISATFDIPCTSIKN
jgi:hypothetical protein